MAKKTKTNASVVSKSEVKRLAALKADEKAAKTAAKLAEKEAKAKIKADEKAKKAAEKAAKKGNKGETTGDIKLTIQYNDQEFVIATDDVQGAILSLKPDHIKSGVAIVAEHANGKVARFNLFGAKARRTFLNPICALVFAKNVRQALGVK